MKKSLLYLLVMSLVLIAIPLTAQQPDFTSALDECQNSTDVDACLADVAYSAGDAGLCVTAPDPATCRDTLTQSVELLCLDVSDPQTCFSGWGVQAGVESACTYLPVEEQAACYLQAAAKSRDFSIIDRQFPEGTARDQANAYAAVLATEPALLGEIDDNQTHDQAYVYMITVMGFGERGEIPDDYCAGLRGDWGGEYPDDADINASICEGTLGLLRTWQAADEEEKDDIVDEMLEALEAGGEEAMLAVLKDRLSTNPIEDAFIRGWCRADEAGVCVEGGVPIMEYDPELDVITHYPRNGPPRIYEAWEEGLYRMYYDSEITNDDGETEVVRYYGEIIVEGPERFSWQFYNHLGRSIGTFSYYVPLPSEEALAD